MQGGGRATWFSSIKQPQNNGKLRLKHFWWIKAEAQSSRRKCAPQKTRSFQTCRIQICYKARYSSLVLVGLKLRELFRLEITQLGKQKVDEVSQPSTSWSQVGGRCHNSSRPQCRPCPAPWTRPAGSWPPQTFLTNSLQSVFHTSSITKCGFGWFGPVVLFFKWLFLS